MCPDCQDRESSFIGSRETPPAAAQPEEVPPSDERRSYPYRLGRCVGALEVAGYGVAHALTLLRLGHADRACEVLEELHKRIVEVVALDSAVGGARMRGPSSLSPLKAESISNCNAPEHIPLKGT